MKAMGISCDATSVGFGLVETGRTVLEEGAVVVPASHQSRGDQLSWLLTETEDLLRRAIPDVVWVRRAGAGQFAASPERHEVEAVVQVAAHRCGVPCELKTTEQVRAAAGSAKSTGAYQALLKRDDVAARSNGAKRERYLFAVTALEASSG